MGDGIYGENGLLTVSEMERRIALEREARTGVLDLSGADIARLPESLFGLEWLRVLSLGGYSIDAKTGNFYDRIIPAQNFIAEQPLVVNLLFLARLARLERLSLWGVPLLRLDGVDRFTAVTELDCSETLVTGLEPLRGLTALAALDCFNTKVASLEPLRGLTALAALNCCGTEVASLEPLRGLTALAALDCSETKVESLEPLRGLTALAELNCCFTEVESLEPLRELNLLSDLICISTEVENLEPALALPSLQQLDAAFCRRLGGLPTDPALYGKRDIVLYGSKAKGVPSELFGEHPGANCAPALEAHFRDLAAGHAERLPSKLMILGNGRVGKTQLKRALRGETFDESVPTTHGVDVAPVPLGDRPDALAAWDFGGQDIYLGAHALFLGSRAILALCWTEALETGLEPGPDGQEFERRPRAYWLDYLAQAAGREAPLLLVETKKPKGGEAALDPATRERFERFEWRRQLSVSAEPPAGLVALREALAAAEQELCDRYGAMLVGQGRLEVMRRLAAMRGEGAARLSFAEFEALCKEVGNVSKPRALADFLDAAGLVLWRGGLFDGDLVLDQDSVLSAVYAIHDRSVARRLIERNAGRFTLQDLAETIWQRESPAVRRQLLGFAVRMGMAFRLSGWRDGDMVYLAPDLLPKAADSDALKAYWREADGAPRVVRYTATFLSPLVQREAIAAFGAIAAAVGHYWRCGLCFFDGATKSWARVDIEPAAEGYGGAVTLAARGPGAEKLLASVERVFVEKVLQRHRLEAAFARDSLEPKAQTLAAPLSPAPEPYSLAVSYAWNDSPLSPKPRLEEPVNALCRQAAEQGRAVFRDKEHMQDREKIIYFMDRLVGSARIAVFLSEKYLKSKYCMYELLGVWEATHKRKDAFAERIRVFCVEDVKIWTDQDRQELASYWKSEAEKAIQAGAAVHTASSGATDWAKHMDTIGTWTVDMLEAIAERKQPRDQTIEAFIADMLNL